MKGRIRAHFNNCTKKGVKRCFWVLTGQETTVYLYIYLKLQRYPKNNTPWKIGWRRRGYNATDELISYGISNQ